MKVFFAWYDRANRALAGREGSCPTFPTIFEQPDIDGNDNKKKIEEGQVT
jgi:hypothetical protein